MKRRRRLEEHESSDRWVVSYADFITLLFAFFTTLYAISHVDLGKLRMFTGSVKTAFRAAGIDAINPAVFDGVKPLNYADISLERDIRAEFNKFGIIENIAISLDQRGVKLSFGDSLFFDSDSAELREEARPFLSAVATLIKRSQRAILIEGHSDNIPLRGGRYSSNIQLSSARAAQTYSFLVEEEALNPERMSVSGYGEFRPIASNATVEGRARNRRVDIIFVAKKDGL